MSEATARNLVSRGAEIAVVANRTLERGEELARKLGARALALDASRPSSSTSTSSSPRRAPPADRAQRETVAAALRARKGRPLLLVDLAVPRDLDPAINELEGCFLYDVDDLEAVVAETLSGRRSEAARAERLVAAEAERFREWQASLDVVPDDRLAARARRGDPRQRARAGRLAGSPRRERRHVESVTSQILAKLLHLPTIRHEGGGRGSRWRGLC